MLISVVCIWVLLIKTKADTRHVVLNLLFISLDLKLNEVLEVIQNKQNFSSFPSKRKYEFYCPISYPNLPSFSSVTMMEF